MKVLSDDFINDVNSRLWGEAASEFGSVFSVPSDKSWRISEYVRGLYVLQVFLESKGGSMDNAVQELKALSVSDTTIEKFVADGVLSDGAISETKSLPRKARLRAFEDWAKGHRGEEFETDFLMEMAGFSRSAMLNYLKISRLFVKVKRGVYRVVDR